MARDHEAILRRLPCALGHTDCETPRPFDRFMFVLEDFVCAAHSWPGQGAPMASVAYSLQGPRFRATMGFLHASFSTAKFACQSYVLLLFALHFYGSCGDNAARFRRVFDARFLARFAAGPASRRNCARARRSLPARGQQGHCVRMWFITVCLFNSVFVSVGVDFRLVPPLSLHLCCRCREAVGFDPASPQKDEHIAICSYILASITALRPLSYRVTVATPLISNVFCEHVYMRFFVVRFF